MKRSSSGYYDTTLSGDKYSGSDWLVEDDWYDLEEWDMFDISKVTGECDHEWEWYQGILESYYFCIKCDEKRESLDE